MKSTELSISFIQNLVKYYAQPDQKTTALSIIKRGIAFPPGEYTPQYKYILHLIPGEQYEFAGFLTATLFAFHPKNTYEKFYDFGTAMAKLKLQTGSESIENRFQSLLQARKEDVHYHFRHAVSLLAANDIPVNYAELMTALRFWEDENNRIQRQWAKSFWKPVKPLEENEILNQDTFEL